MRGKHTLFQNLLLKAKPARKNVIKPGRSKRLLESRDRCMAARFFYYTVIKQNQYNPTMQALCKEFYLSEEQIADRLMQQKDYLKEIKTAAITARELGKAYPWMNWSG